MTKPRPVLVTGWSGQLAGALDAVAADHGLVAQRIGRPTLDFDRPASLAAAIEATNPSLVVNPPAYTAVDAAEDEPEAPFRANRDVPAELARLCAQDGI